MSLTPCKKKNLKKIENRFKILHEKLTLTIESIGAHDSRIRSTNINESNILINKFKEHLNCLGSASTLIATSRHATKISFKFISAILEALPSSTFCERKNYEYKKIVKFAKNVGFRNVLVINQEKNKINSMLLINMSSSTEALFRISNLKLKAALPGCGRPSKYQPEVMLNNFNTMTGRKIAYMFASMFHQEPQFIGRKVVVFNNQRDFIFFRHYRYIFNKKLIKSAEKKESPKFIAGVFLQELGPRFTLNLETIYNSTDESKTKKYEFLRHPNGAVNRHATFL